MEIEKGVSPLGYTTLEFVDVFDTLCRLWVLKNAKHLRLEGNADAIQFSQEDIKSLLPYLQVFAETGVLEPQSTLQGGSLAEAFKPENLIRVSAEQNVKLYDQERRIAQLEQLVEEWRILHRDTVANPSDQHVWQDCYSILQEKTSQLLGE